MITKEIIKRALKKGIITVDVLEDYDGAVGAKIGERAFYFGSSSNYYSLQEFKESHSKKEIVRDIYNTLMDMASDKDGLFNDEMMYYTDILRNDPRMKKTVKFTISEEVFCFDPSEYFDDIMITGNNRLVSYIPKWGQEAIDMIRDFDSCLYSDMSFEECKEFLMNENDFTFENISDEKLELAINAWNNYNNSSDPNLIAKIINILHPDYDVKVKEIRGYSQGDWNVLIYKNSDKECVDNIESYYFGNVKEVYMNNPNEQLCILSATVPDNKIWEWERNNELAKKFCELFDLSEDTKCSVYRETLIPTTKVKREKIA